MKPVCTEAGIALFEFLEPANQCMREADEEALSYFWDIQAWTQNLESRSGSLRTRFKVGRYSSASPNDAISFHAFHSQPSIFWGSLVCAGLDCQHCSRHVGVLCWLLLHTSGCWDESSRSEST